MFGWVTPKRSIRFLRTLNEFAIALSDSSRITLITSSFEVSGLIFSRISKVPKMLESLLPGATSFQLSSNRVMKSALLSSSFFWAKAKASTNSGDWLPSASATIRSLSCTCNITFIPPLRSRPRLISFSFTSL